IAGFPALAQKETSEPALLAGFSAFSKHLNAFLASPSPDSSTLTSALTFLTSGVSDSKATLRRAHFMCLQTGLVGDSLKSLSEKQLAPLVDAAVKIVDKIQAAGVALLDPKKETPFLAEGYLAVRWLLCVIEWESKSGKNVTAGTLEKKKFFPTLLSTPAAKSWFLNEKYYAKLLTSAEEQLPFLDSLITVLKDINLYNLVGSSDSVQEKMPLASSLSFFMVLSTFPTVRRHAAACVKSLIESNDEVLARVCRMGRLGLGAILQDPTKFVAPPSINPSMVIVSASDSTTESTTAWADDKTRASKEFSSRLFTGLHSLIPLMEPSDAPPSRPLLESALMDLVILTTHPMVSSTVGSDVWIRLCLRADVDPTNLVERFGPQVVTLWMDSVSASAAKPVEDATLGGLGKGVPESFRRATLSALTLFTSVAPEAVMACLLPKVFDALDDKLVEGISAQDVEIWKGEEGVLVIDPLNRKKNNDDDDRPRTAEEKWERELRKEIQAKKGASAIQPKPAASKPAGKPANAKAAAQAKAEKEAERVQLEKESEIRKHVSEIQAKVLAGLEALESVISGVVNSLDDEAKEVFELWSNKVVRAVLRVVSRELTVCRKGKEVPKGAVLVGRKVIDVFRSVAKTTDYRTQMIISSGWDVATLRLMGIEEGGEGIPEELCKKTLSGLVVVATKLLVAGKGEFTASDPLSPGSFAYIYPLVSTIIQKAGRTTTFKDKMLTELIMYASDILISHCGLGGSPFVPRQAMLHDLVELVTKYPRLHGAAREGILTLCVSLENAVADEDFDDLEDSIQQLMKDDERAITNELLDALLSVEPVARQTACAALQHMSVPEGSKDGLAASRVWVAKFDDNEGISTEAERVWEMWNEDASLQKGSFEGVLSLITHDVDAIRSSAGRSLAAALQVTPDLVGATMEKLYHLYEEKNVVPMPEYDEYGMVIPESLNKKDEWPARSGIAQALKASANLLTESDPLTRFFKFMIEQEALGDREEKVRSQMLEAGVAAINGPGKHLVAPLVKIFSDVLSRPAAASQTSDWIRESTVILLGTVAQHLDAKDKKIPEVVDRLVETLKTPSEVVQVAVSECLPALVKPMTDGIDSLIQRLLRMLFDSPKYAERRGAAYGLAGVVRGRGISALKEYGIMNSLKDAVEDKKKIERREGALFAYEALSFSLGRLFEPYVIQILPLLLVCYGDSNKDVRTATSDACSTIMSKLSGHCVKLVMPSLLKGLEDKAWRAKTGSIEMLGSMASLAPKQLSISLPTIVPRLCEVLSDSHQKVQETAKDALNQFGRVIKNPEIQELVPTLIAALVDPNSKTLPALTALIDTSFVHYIDSPSLALIVPVLQRGLTERATETKKKAAQIVGQMASLTDQKDLIPYLSTLLPGLKDVLVDPVPETRGIAAKALGSMFAKLGESNFPGLVSELLQTVKSEVSAVDRSGAAQGLSEILAGTNIEKMEGLLPEVIHNAMSVRPFVREGFMTMLVFLPVTFGDRFQPYLASIIPPVLRGLADEQETVRDMALKAGKVVVKNYATKAVDLLLPELETGLFDDNWRIRQSSLQLM
ncbi:translational activator of GCN4, partial [Chytridiales sp. JEL 0842]